jgi:hypothetical protein
MIGWACIVAHFAGMLLFSFKPDPLAPGGLVGILHPDRGRLRLLSFGLPDARLTAGPRRVFWSAMVAPGGGVLDLHGFRGDQPGRLPRAAGHALGAGVWLALRESQQSAGSLAPWFTWPWPPGLWAAWRVSTHVETGIDFLLFEGFAITGWRYWRYFRRWTPGVLLTSLALSGLGPGLSGG